MVGYSNDLGSIHYSEEVLAKIVGLSTMEWYGVVGMVSKNATEGLWELMRIENLSKGVKLNFNDDDKLIIVPNGKNYSDDAINALVEFQERYFEHTIIR